MKHFTLSLLFLFIINLAGFPEQISETTAKIVGINFITTNSNSDIYLLKKISPSIAHLLPVIP